MSEPSDWQDYKQVEKFYQERRNAYLKISSRYLNAMEKGDDEAKKKAADAMRKHRKKDEVYKKKAENSYFYWY
jgi:hypothetical protein